MPAYEFRKPDGSVTTAYFSLSEMPSIGETVEIDGETCVRIVSSPQISEDVKNVVHKYPYESHVLESGWSDTGPTGGQVVYSRRHEREIMNRSRENGPGYERI